MPCGMEVGLGPGDCVRWGPSSPVPKRGAEPPNFGPCPWWPNGWMYQDGTWHGGGPWYRLHCARRGPSSPPKKGSGVPCPIFDPFLFWTNGWMHQDATWYGGIGLGPGTLCSMGTQLPKNKCSAVAEMGDRLATRHGPKMGGCVPFRNFNKNSSGDEIANVNFITTTSHM